MIKRLSAAHLDKTAWDDCVNSDAHGLIYALSWYLDIVAPNWEGVVLEDQNNYTLVMPLPERSIVGLPVISIPLLIQQLGIFSSDRSLIQKFLPQILSLAFNNGKGVEHYSFRPVDRPLVNSFIPLTNFDNYVLPLSSNYQQIQAGYHPNRLRDVRKAIKAGLEVKEGTWQWPEVLKLYQDNVLDRLPKKQRQKLLIVLPSFIQAALKQNFIRVLAVYLPADRLIAGAILLTYQNRITYLLPAIDMAGKKVGAGTYLLDYLCRQEAGTNQVLDFEGSKLPGIAKFYASFGAQPETYGFINHYQLTTPLKWMVALRKWLFK